MRSPRSTARPPSSPASSPRASGRSTASPSPTAAAPSAAPSTSGASITGIGMRPASSPPQKLIEMLSRKRYQGRLWVDQVDGEFGHDDPLPVDPWVLGALIGRWMRRRQYAAVFSSASEEMVERMHAQIGEGMRVELLAGLRLPARECVPVPGVQEEWRRPNAITEGLRELGLWGLGSHEKFIPADVPAGQPECPPQPAAGPARYRWLGGEVGLGPLLHGQLPAREGRQWSLFVPSAAVRRSSDKRTSYSYKGEKREGRRRSSSTFTTAIRVRCSCCRRSATGCPARDEAASP